MIHDRPRSFAGPGRLLPALLLPALALLPLAGCTVETERGADEVEMEAEVDTVDGTVTLTGEVESEEDRADAVEVARETEGVRDVVDNLQVEGEPRG